MLLCNPWHIRSVAYSTGYSYTRWKKGLDVQLLKKNKDHRAEKLRTIFLLEEAFQGLPICECDIRKYQCS
jgi:hypothetical protein